MNQTVLEKIKDNARKSLVAGDKKKTNTLRYLISLLQNEEIKLGEKFDNPAALAILQKEMKKKEESLAMFQKAKRDELIKDQKEEIEILKGYLPKMMSEEEVEASIRKIVDQEKELDFGKIMGKVMAQLKGKADGKLVSDLLRKVLS